MKHPYKKILFAFFFSLQVSFLNAQWVTIPDTNFVNWLDANGYAGCMNGNLMDTTCNAVVSATYVNCSSKNISDLNGIQYFDNLWDLDCNDNAIVNLPNLPNSLLTLVCRSNPLISLPLLPGTLTVLDCSNNQLSSLPTLPNSLQVLYCQMNQLSSLPSLPNSLTELECHTNNLTSLPALPNTVFNLYCSYNPLNSLPPLPDSLIYLICEFNQLSSLPVLPDSLIHLYCSHNQLTSIPALPPNLINLWCDNNLLTSLPVLPNSLDWLACSYNQLTSLPTLSNSLRILRCHQNQITILPQLNDSLRVLWCNSNFLTSLPNLPPLLTDLLCSSNQLSALPSLPTTLTSLICSGSQLLSVPVLPDSLLSLNLDDNPNLTCLQELKRIVYLNFSNTAITCLPNYGTVTNSMPLLSSLPLCDLFNTNGCTAYWNISGKVYSDTNNNCIADNGELRLSNMKLLLDSAGILIQQAYTGGEGFYSFDTDTGNYTYTVDTTDLPVIVTCPAAGFQTSVLTATDSMDYDMDFGMQCKPGFDVGVTSVSRDSGIFRPAHFARVKILAGDISNFYGLHCAAGISGMVQVVFSGDASYIGTSAGSLTPVVSGDTLLYTVADFGSINYNSDFSFVMQTDTAAVAGSQVCFDVSVLPVAGDINPSNNSLQHCFTVVNSVDPNTKEVFPEGNIDTAQHWLTYTIHFQNTGSAPAEHIYIMDTLDNNLDESSFTLLSYSYQPLTQVVGKVVRFNFPNINLADSTSDETQSHGYVQFKVKLKTGLTNGTLIHNTGHIVFDFNAPVTTNTTENVIQITTNLTPNLSPKVRGVQVVPNPAHDEVNIVFSSTEKFTIEIVNTLGESLVKKENQKRIDVSELAKGIYFVKVFFGNNLVTEKFIKQ